jgi:predicted transcriptional regulator
MSDPEGGLTRSQFEILQVLWANEATQSHRSVSVPGLTVAEIWEEIGRRRQVARTTALNLVDRLEKRGWLAREKVAGVFRYRPTRDRASTEQLLAAEFVDEFFAGSASQLLLSLLGSSRPSQAELLRLRALLDAPTKGKSKPKE